MEPCAELSQPVAAEVVDRAPIAAVEPAALAVRDEQGDRLRALEDEIHRRALVCLDSVSRWTDIHPDQELPPREWVEELGLEGAQKRLRVAKSAWMSAKEAPIGIKVAKEVAVGIAKARATEKGGGTTLAIQTVNFVSPRYEVIEVASDG